MSAPIALVDCNNFYASCERLFQPELRGKPVIVLSNNDGCVIARSNEAKALGVAMGDPWHLVKDKHKAKGIIVRSSNYTLYGDLSARVMRTLSNFTPDLEIYSIDEAFLSLAGFEGRLDGHARDIRETVVQWTGIPVSVGIAPTKTLAKLANRLAKKDPASGGMLSLATVDAQKLALAQIKLTDLWGVAGRLAARLEAIGIRTPLELRNASPRFVRERCSVVMERMVHELRGEPCLDLEEVTPDRKSIMASRSFGRSVTKLRELEEAVATHTARAAEKMRRQNLATASVVVFVHTNQFKPSAPQYYGTREVELPVASADTTKLIGAAMRALSAVWRKGFGYSKAGVIFPVLCQAADAQPDLFAAPDTAGRKRLMRTVDSLNSRYGRGAITYGTMGRQHGWKLRSDHKSPHYTTDWDQLLKV